MLRWNKEVRRREGGSTFFRTTVFDSPRDREIRDGKLTNAQLTWYKTDIQNRLGLSAKRKRQLRVRKKVIGTEERPRLCVHRTNNHMSAALAVDSIELLDCGSF